MIHEILLSLSGHPSPLLTSSHDDPTSILSSPEKALLKDLAHLSNLHYSLRRDTQIIVDKHPSVTCQAVATSIRADILGAFQRKILEVEEGVLKRDAKWVGGADGKGIGIVPLTSVVGEFRPWVRRLEWLQKSIRFMKGKTGAQTIDYLVGECRTGYVDVEEVALGLVRTAEMAWLRLCSGWVLYGKLPGFGREDFFVQRVGGSVEEYELKRELLPAFVSNATAGSLLFIGRSLNHIRVKSVSRGISPELDLVTKHLKELSTVQFPINSANFSRVIASIRLSLSQTTLQKLLPTSKVIEVLSLLRDFFLLGRGEFANALINEADEKIRSRWRRADNIGYEKRDGLSNIVVKEGEVSAVLSRTWAAMGSLQGRHEEHDEDELLELARDLVQLNIIKPTPSKPTNRIADTPFATLLLSVPVTLTMHIPSPLDLFLTSSDLTTYSAINAYLLSIHRAHLRLTDLWKITTLRRDHPAPPGPPYGSSKSGKAKTRVLRERARERGLVMRNVWATSSAATFFLGETEAWLQGVVGESWTGFGGWVGGEVSEAVEEGDSDDDIWISAGKVAASHPHDPQTLTHAHTRYLSSLAHDLLLTTPSFTNALYTLLQQVDRLVGLVYRLQSLWLAMDLESDEGVVDAYLDLGREEGDVKAELRVVCGVVREGVRGVVAVLGRDVGGDAGWSEDGDEVDEGEDGDGKAYIPVKVGRVDRLLMKLDFGGWFDDGVGGGERDDGF